MECRICFSTIKNSCIGSCSHHFCFECLLRWCKKNNSCPVCRSMINQIIFDKEFDELVYKYNLLLNKLGSENDELGLDELGDIEFGHDEIENIGDGYYFLNITICYDDIIMKNLLVTFKNNKGPGVIVSKIDKNGRAYHYGLRLNDNILFINNISCINHKQSICIFNYCDLSRKNIVCKIIRK